MITFLLIIGLVIALGLCASEFILIKILLQKIDTYEAWILNFKSDVMSTAENMRAIDKGATFKSSFLSTEKGVFESDDQVGVVFKELLDLIEKLNQRTQ
ncbi:MAG TPA: hypothetical protein VMW91_11230 [Desulfosporosinus sp.]|nr:hypothetical protein [Desulfosporosinus sp.]